MNNEHLQSLGETTLDDVYASWKSAQIVEQSPSFQGEPKSRHYLELLAHHPEYESCLVSLLDDNHQIVVAYALLCLELMGSNCLMGLPPNLLGCNSKITLSQGSFRTKTDLSGLARQIQKRAIEQRSHRDDNNELQ